MRGASPSQAEPLNIGWGLNPNSLTAATTDVGPFDEASESRVAGTSSVVTTTTTNDTYQVVGTITASGAETIAEVFLSDSASKPFSTTVAGGAGVIGSTTSTALTTASSYTPSNNTYVQIRTECLEVTAGSGTTSLTVVRAQNGTTAISTIAASDPVTAGNPPGQTGVTNGSLFLHGDFAGIALNSSDSIQFTVKVQYQ